MRQPSEASKTSIRVFYRQFNIAIAVLCGSLLLSPLAARVLPSAVTVCGYRQLTGKPCPFCGLTHQLSLVLNGRLSETTTAGKVYAAILLWLILQRAAAFALLKISDDRLLRKLFFTDVTLLVAVSGGFYFGSIVLFIR